MSNIYLHPTVFDNHLHLYRIERETGHYAVLNPDGDAVLIPDPLSNVIAEAVRNAQKAYAQKFPFDQVEYHEQY